MIPEDEQIYIAVSDMDVFVRVWGGNGQLGSVMADGVLVPIDPGTGIGELKLGVGKALKNTTIDFAAAFIKTNPLSASALLRLEFFQRRDTSATRFNVTEFGPLDVPFNEGTEAERQTSVSII